MPTFEPDPRFLSDYAALTEEERAAFRTDLAKFIADLRRGRFRASLNVHRLEGHRGIWAMEWAGDGRATFQYGDPVRPGEPDIIWRRIGGHEIYERP